nr:nuclear transport factor 2 family protein [uncultured Chryseobacterium sp.]
MKTKTTSECFLILSVFLTLFNCTQPSVVNKTEDKNEKIVKTYFQLFNQHDWQRLADMYNPDADFKDPSLGQGIFKQTKSDFIKKYAELNQIFPDLKDKVIKTYPSGEKNIIVEFVSSGTAADQSTFELPVCTVFTIEDGKITQDFTYYDNFDESVK